MSGGEPLCQIKFAKEIAKECKKRDLSVALDTSGYFAWSILNDVLQYIDLILFDIKHLNSKEHKKYTGVGNDIILENIKRISQKKFQIIIRIPVIPGINDSTRNIKEIANFINSLTCLQEVHLLPYHRLGINKYKALGRVYSLMNLKQPTSEFMFEVKKLLDSFNIKSTIIS